MCCSQPISVWIIAAFAGLIVMHDSDVRSQTLPEENPLAGSATPTEVPGTDDELNFDELLNIAEQDVSQLSQVKVVSSVPSLDMEVTTVSRVPSTVGKTPAAVFVITNEMIRRSGATSVPEVLRMAPGVQVARVDANKWAISIRGFNDRFANKLLVQIDGRTVYSPLYAGVFWDVQDLLLEDVERIEVIRGPGATVWGANAVNGVINILTKKAADTQGLYLQSGAGSFERGFLNLRYGGQIGEDIDYRVHGRWLERGTGSSIDSPLDPADDWRLGGGGFRIDWDPDRAGDDLFTLQGGTTAGRSGGTNVIPTLPPPFSTTVANDLGYSESNVLGRWTHRIDDQREWQLQSYFWGTTRDQAALGFFEDRGTFDIDLQYRCPAGDRHQLVMGAGSRWSSDRLPGGVFPSGFSDEQQTISMYSAFIQDHITLAEDRWFLTLGSKFIEHSYVGFDYQPTMRLLFTPDDRRSVWAAVSRAIRLPSRGEETALLFGPPVTTTPIPIYAGVVGSSALNSEQLLAWELGYRMQQTDQFSWDLATFYNQYDDLISFQQGRLTLTPHAVVVPLNLTNAASATSYGVELAANYEMHPDWKLRGAYTYLSIFQDGDVAFDGKVDGSDPHHQLYVQSSTNLGKRTELDLTGRYVGELSALNVSSYFVSDVRLAWRPSEAWECFVVGRGLFDDGHEEFEGDVAIGGLPTGVRSEIFAGVSLRR